MNLKELKMYIDFTIENLQNHQSPDDIEVLITLSERSIGSRACTRVSHVGMGMDWESGQFRISPEKEIVSKGNNFTDIKRIKCIQYDSRNYYFCPRCESKIAKDDKFCRCCSQGLR